MAEESMHPKALQAKTTKDFTCTLFPLSRSSHGVKAIYTAPNGLHFRIGMYCDPPTELELGDLKIRDDLCKSPIIRNLSHDACTDVANAFQIHLCLHLFCLQRACFILTPMLSVCSCAVAVTQHVLCALRKNWEMVW